MRKLLCASPSHLSTAACLLRSKAEPNSNAHVRSTVATAPTGRCVLDVLPHDILILILGFLDGRALLRCKGVSRLVSTLMSANMLLTYRIELVINGMVDGPPSSGLTIPERLEKLRKYSERSCTRQFTLDTEMKRGRLGFGELTCLMTPRDPRPPLPDSFGGVVCFELEAVSERSLVVYAPPSIVESSDARRWTIPLPSPSKRVLAVDVTQDLVIALAPVPGNPGNGEMFLLSLESGGSAAHPLAEEPILEIDWRRARLSALKIKALQIFGPYIAWNMPYGGDEFGDHLQVRNWKTGCTLWELRMNDIPSYTFINTSYLAMVFNSSDNHRSHVHRRCPDTIRIYRFREERALPVGHVATFQLPQDVRGSTIVTPSVPCPPTPPRSAAFWPDPEQRVVVLRLRVLDPLPPTKKIMRILQPNHLYTPNQAAAERDALLVVPCAALHKHLMRVTAAGRNPAPDLPIPWEDWGLRGSVLIREEGFADPPSLSRGAGQWPLSKFVFPFGSRLTFFYSGGSSASDSGPRLVTLDVNPLAKLHPPHPGCTRRDALISAEKTDEPDVSPDLKTTHAPCSYYFGPHFPDVQHTLAITQSASGYAVLTQRQDPEYNQTMGGVQAFTVS